jgi:hypothetical protein
MMEDVIERIKRHAVVKSLIDDISEQYHLGAIDVKAYVERTSTAREERATEDSCGRMQKIPKLDDA